MKQFLLSVAFILCVTEIFPHNKVLFEIGRQDNSASEFALYPDQYDSFLANFSGEKSYYVGYSSPDKQWPYAFPGPVDSWGGGGYWAGYHPRHFPSIWFQVEKTTRQGDCKLSLFFVGVNHKHPVKIRMEVNGHRFEEMVTGKDSITLLNGETRNGTPQSINITFPASWLVQGINRIHLGTIAGSWVIFNRICLE
ncbi:MAG: hypothetical protein LBB62_09670, partial [Proteiniphilum sp.]|nr:hypothetical protein [Proteiniphilum sp.]